MRAGLTRCWFEAAKIAVGSILSCSRARATAEFWTRVDRKMLWSLAASSDQQCARVLASVKARRSAPPPLRGAQGLDPGSAHARPDWLLPTMPDPDPLHVVVDELSRMTPFRATVDISRRLPVRQHHLRCPYRGAQDIPTHGRAARAGDRRRRLESPLARDHSPNRCVRTLALPVPDLPRKTHLPGRQSRPRREIDLASTSPRTSRGTTK